VSEIRYSIYCIKNKQNDRKYIGQTVQKPEKIWNNHIWSAKNGVSTQLIHLALHEFGEDSFEFEILATTNNLHELDRLEAEYIQDLNTLHPHGYNMKEGGINGHKAHGLPRKKRDPIQLLNGLVSEKTLSQIIDLCRKQGVYSFTGYGISFTLTEEAPLSSYKRKKLESVPNEKLEASLTEEDYLLWSATDEGES